MKRTVFWSWQSDLPAAITREFIKHALTQALKRVNSDLELEQAERFELDHDTKGEAGLVEIVKTIFEKIDDCDVFVADITPVAEVLSSETGKKVPNPNVMIELGYALHELGHKRIITVANLAFGGKPEDLPFDLRHRRGAITYSLQSAEDPSYKKEKESLVNQLTGALRVNLEAPREDRLVRNPRPALSLETIGKVADVPIIEQVVNLNEVPTLDEIKLATPLRSKNDKGNSGFSLTDSYFSAPLGFGTGSRRKPFKEWTQEELSGYNSRVQLYYQEYEEYLDALKEHQLLLQRTIVVEIALVNSGTLPATDIRASISFPATVLVYENDDLPKPPPIPSAPPFAPYGHPGVTILQGRDPAFDRLWEKPRRISEDRRSIEFKSSKLQQGYRMTFNSFTLIFPSMQDIKNCEAQYHITADELTSSRTGTLCFEIKRADS